MLFILVRTLFFLLFFIVRVNAAIISDDEFQILGFNESQSASQQIVNSNVKKEFNWDFHRLLEKNFPDWDARMEYQAKQQSLYESAMEKLLDKELDAIEYFHGLGFYKNYQDLSAKPNVYDTRQTFLLKMHNREMRNKFLTRFRAEFEDEF